MVIRGCSQYVTVGDDVRALVIAIDSRGEVSGGSNFPRNFFVNYHSKDQ